MQASTGSSWSPYSRRPRARDSVSLRQTQALGTGPFHASPQPPTEPSRLLRNRDSSGETSNAEHWFDDFNKRGPQHQPNSNAVEPPFFLHNNDPNSPRPGTFSPNLSSPSRRRPHFFASQSSTSDDYRSVIDDLTIENRRLKWQLQRLQRRHQTLGDKDRLFEVKTHDLPGGKKQELEEILRNFAIGLDRSPANGPTESLATSTIPKYPSAMAGAKASSSMASTRIADSGYGSMTASHQASTATSGRGPPRPSGIQTPKSRNHTIRSYLHDIPEGLLPRQLQPMSHQRLQKLVVRRLEQQQEVSQSAAQADHRQLEAQGRKAGVEGLREARIMDTETEDPMYLTNVRAAISKLPTLTVEDRLADGIESHDFASASTPPSTEQRPTRPLDLDPDRALVAADNLEYFRHLGFLGHGKNTIATASKDNDDYIYLNLLINIAQLHTLNVTTDFVKTALAEHGRNLELSSDGRKLRWRGDHAGEYGSFSDAEQGFDSMGQPLSGKKRRRAGDSDSTEGHPSKRLALRASTRSEPIAYRPQLIAEHACLDEGSEVSNVDAQFEQPSPLHGHDTGASSGWTSAMHQRGFDERHQERGPIVFYKKAPFCTDLNGDTFQPSRPSHGIQYSPATAHLLGVEPSKQAALRRTTSTEHNLQTLNIISKPPSLLEISNAAQMEIPASTQCSSPRRVKFAEPDDVLPLEASGVGGVMPSDHFCYTVCTRRTPIRPTSARSVRRKHSVLAATIASLQRKPGAEHHIEEQIVSTSKTDLDPSPLPPATMHFSSTDSDLNSGSEAVSNDNSFTESASGSSTSVYRHHNFDALAIFTRMQHRARAALHHSGASPASSGFSSSASVEPNLSCSSAGSESDDGSDDDDDQSLDFLATAREVDPEAIRAKEREYDAQMAERLADEIPAGSSAATAGGGSGFASPSATDPDGDADFVDGMSVSS